SHRAVVCRAESLLTMTRLLLAANLAVQSRLGQPSRPLARTIRVMRPLRTSQLRLVVSVGSIVCAAALPACQKAEGAAPPPPAASATAAAEAPRPSTARLLALSKSEGTAPVDVQIAAAQNLLGEHPD